MNIVAGMMLVCWVKVHGIASYNFFVKDVPTKILYVTDDKQAVVQYDFTKAPGIAYYGPDKVTDTEAIENLVAPTYMRCKEQK